MPAISATAPGKIILFGEHAVVYGRPAIAVPVQQVRARVVVTAEPRGQPGEVRVLAPDIGLDVRLADLSENQPLAKVIQSVLSALGISFSPACMVRVTSTIPVAAGMGSGAAVSVAALRAFSTFLGHPLPAEQVSDLAYEVEKLYHGTPSGIDNTVITYAIPVVFVRSQPIQLLRVERPFTVVIADTGVRSPTSVVVGDLRRLWQADPQLYESLFDAAGRIALSAQQAIENGRPETLGPLMDENHHLLGEMGVSSLELDRLVQAARSAGALGAKLSGAGRGGNMIALASPATAPSIAQALQSSGAVRTIITQIEARN
jgi:mevalonate kinase